MIKLTKEHLKSIHDRISLEAGRGSYSQSFYDQLSGINILSTPATLPQIKDRSGLTFFTRPRLNLSDANIRAWPPFYPMLGDDDRTALISVVRALLDPVGCWKSDINGKVLTSPLMDNRSPFIPWLTNSMISMSGWQEILAGTYTSSEGNYHEAYTIIDDTIKNFRVFDLNSSHRNTQGNFLGILLYVWVATASLQYEGEMIPYPDSIRNRRRNYNTRIYRFSTDEHVRRVEEWWSTIAYPYMAPTAVNANYSVDNPFNMENQQVSISWKCTGMQTYDPRTLTQFNGVQIYFNPWLHARHRGSHFVELKESEWSRFNYRCSILIDPDTKLIHRFVPKELYERVNNTLAKRIFTPNVDRRNPAVVADDTGTNDRRADILKDNPYYNAVDTVLNQTVRPNQTGE